MELGLTALRRALEKCSSVTALPSDDTQGGLLPLTVAAAQGPPCDPAGTAVPTGAVVGPGGDCTCAGSAATCGFNSSYENHTGLLLSKHCDRDRHSEPEDTHSIS